MDTKTPEARSRNMARIKSSKTKPEMFIRSELHRRGFRFRVNFAKIPGKPDVYFTKKRVAIFVHGCFWHQHPGCKYASMPKSNSEYWKEKLAMNRIRDESTIEELISRNVRVLVIWECTIKKMQKDLDYKRKLIDVIVDQLSVEPNDTKGFVSTLSETF